MSKTRTKETNNLESLTNNEAIVLNDEVVQEIKQSFDNFANPKPEAITPYDERIIRYYGEGKSVEMLARMFTVHKSTIEKIIANVDF